MVQTNRPFFEDEQPSFRRFSTRGNGYALNHERGLSLTALPLSYEDSRTSDTSNLENRHDESAAGADSSLRPRSRIPVACQRCRKRKIRCSGDNGGGVCSNCRNAGCAEQCQFLRVSSQDVSMKADATITEYIESPATSRFHYRMVAQALPFLQTSPSAEFDPYQYRGNSVSTYPQYSNKNFGSGMSYAEFESPVDYGLQSSTYQLIPQEHFRTPSPICNQFRGWEGISQLPRGSELFVEQEQQIYSPEHLPVTTNSGLPFSPVSDADPKDTEEPGLPSLPHSNTYEPNERPILPNPVANRPGPINALLRNNDGNVSSTQLGNYKDHHNGQYRDLNMSHPSKTQSQSTTSDSYTYDIRFSNTNHESLTYGENNNTMPPAHHHDGLYAPTTNMHYHPNALSSMSRQFAQVPSSMKKDSYTNTSRSQDGPLPSIADGELSNGHRYIPYRNSSSSYPTPPMGMPPLPPVQRTACIQSHQ